MELNLKGNRTFTLDNDEQTTRIRFDPYTLGYTPRPQQIKAYNLIDKGYNVCIVLPTGMGKTNIAFYAFQQAVDRGKKFMMLLPLKALVEEMHENLSRYFNVIPLSGDYRHNKFKLFEDGIQGYCLTYEMAYQLLIVKKYREKIYGDIDWIAIDEAHLMGDPSRGGRIESFLMIIGHYFPNIRIILLSATIGNPDELSGHFKMQLIYAPPEARPVPLEIAIRTHRPLMRNEDRLIFFKDIIGEIVRYFRKRAEDLDKEKPIYPSYLIFTQSRRMATKLCKIFQKSDLKKLNPIYHHAGLSKEKRKEIEEKFRKGVSKLLFCTPTLAMGVNIPADIVVIAGIMRINPLTWKKEVIGANELIQMIGRAGRGGRYSALYKIRDGKKFNYGKAIILCPEGSKSKIEHYINNPFEIKSVIPENLKYYILTWIAAGFYNSASLMGLYLRLFNISPDKEHFDKELQWLEKYGFFIRDPARDEFRLTLKGQTVVIFAISPYTVLYFLKLKKILIGESPKISPAEFFILLFYADEFSNQIRINRDYDLETINTALRFISRNKLEKILERFEGSDDRKSYGINGPGGDEPIENRSVPSEISDRIHIGLGRALKGFVFIYHNYITSRYSPNPGGSRTATGDFEGDLSDLRENVKRMVLAAALLLGERWKYGKHLRTIKKGLEFNPPVFDDDIYDWLKVPGVGIRTATLLVISGYKTYSEFLSTPNNVIAANTSKTAKKINAELRAYNSLRFRSDLQYFKGELNDRSRILERGGIKASNRKKTPLWRGLTSGKIDKIKEKLMKMTDRRSQFDIKGAAHQSGDLGEYL